jgi:hypothetical protein
MDMYYVNIPIDQLMSRNSILNMVMLYNQYNVVIVDAIPFHLNIVM